MGLIKKTKDFLVWIIGQLFVQIICSVLILPIIPTWIMSRPSIKNKLLEIIKFNEIFLLISVFSTIALVIALCWAIYLYWKHERYHQHFGVLWDNNYIPRCHTCKYPLKFGTDPDKHHFFCSNKSCDNKYVLKTDDGVQITTLAEAKALLMGKEKEPSGNIRRKWWFNLIVFVAGIALAAIFHNRIVPPKIPNPEIEITYNYLKTAPRQIDFSGAVHLDYEPDEKVSGLLIFIHNQGKKEDKNFEFSIYTRHEDIKIKPATIVCDPNLLHFTGSRDYNDGKNGCYRKLETFPINAQIYVEIFAETAINEGDIDFEFLSDHSVWTAIEGEIKFERRHGSLGRIEIFKKAFAEQAQNETNQKKSPSGVLIGGYDPLIMTNNLFKVLQEEKLLTRQQAQEIKIIVEAEKKGVLFGGVNILKFNEVALNALIRNNVFSKNEALDILQKSKDSGGVLIGGYNIVVLEVEILNLLVKKHKLDLHKAQSAVDNAKGISNKSNKVTTYK